MARIKNFNQHLFPLVFRLHEGGPENSDYLNNIKIVIKGDVAASDLAKKVVGDQKEPNQFFVTASTDYMFFDNDMLTAYSDEPKKAPVKTEDHIEVETFGPFEFFKDAMKKATDLDLSETTGPRYIMLEDRKVGLIYEKFLKAEMKIVWSEETNDKTKEYGYIK